MTLNPDDKTDPWANDVTGWLHEDGTPCPEYLAPVNGTRWWCTEHQQYLKRPDEEAVPDVIEGTLAPTDAAVEELRAAGFPVISAAASRAVQAEAEQWAEDFAAASRASERGKGERWPS